MAVCAVPEGVQVTRPRIHTRMAREWLRRAREEYTVGHLNHAFNCIVRALAWRNGEVAS